MCERLVLFLIFASPVYADIPVEVKNQIPLQTLQQATPSLEGRQWNRYTTDNGIVIISLDNGQGKYLSRELDAINDWIYGRWGLPSVNWSKSCMIICVEDPQIYKLLFGMSNSKVEIEKDKNVIFFLLDDKPSKTLPPMLTEVCLVEFENKYNVKFDWWIRRGMAMLNGDVADIRADIANFKEKEFTATDLLLTTKQDYDKMNDKRKWSFDTEAMMLCLMFVKEMGKNRFVHFLKTASESNSKISVQTVYGFQSFDDFNQKFSTYIDDLTGDVSGLRKPRITPDNYLVID